MKYKKNYTAVDISRYGEIILFEKGEKNNLEANFKLSFSNQSLLHYSLDTNTFSYISMGGGSELPGMKVLDPVYLDKNFSIEILVQPYKEQVAYAAILGNHPGKGYEGFVIQQNGVNQMSIPLALETEKNGCRT